MSLISHSTASSSISKICLVCETESTGFKYMYEVFLIDPCSGGRRRRRGPRVLREPLFRIPSDYPFPMSFFAFDSSIYFFGECFAKDSSSRDVFVYDTSSSDSTIKKVSCMNRGKFTPVIIGPLKEKFYLISCSVSNHDFERFDPKLDSWDLLCQPPVPYNRDFLDVYFIYAYAVNNDREILLSTPCGLFSYDIDQCNWSLYPGASIPFVNDTFSGSISIGGDRFLGFIQRRDDVYTSLRFSCGSGHLVLGTYRYNSSEHTWHDFESICDWPPKVGCYAYPMSLGDGIVCGVVSGYDLSASDYDNPEPSRHSVLIGIFGDGPKFKPLHFREYKDKYNMKRCKRNIKTCFPMFGVAPSHGKFCIPPNIGVLQDKITENSNSAISADEDIGWSNDDVYMEMFDPDRYDLVRGVGTCSTPSQKTIQSVPRQSCGLAMADDGVNNRDEEVEQLKIQMANMQTQFNVQLSELKSQLSALLSHLSNEVSAD